MTRMVSATRLAGLKFVTSKFKTDYCLNLLLPVNGSKKDQNIYTGASKSVTTTPRTRQRNRNAGTSWKNSGIFQYKLSFFHINSDFGFSRVFIFPYNSLTKSNTIFTSISDPYTQLPRTLTNMRHLQ